MSSSSTHITIAALAPNQGGLRTFTLPRVAPDEFKNPGRSYTIKLPNYRLNSRLVSRCQLTAESPSDPATVILKFARARQGESHQPLERREKEATRYVEDLKELQGKEVPDFLGFYKGEDPWGYSWACILLEDCGDNLQRHDMVTYRVQIGLALARLHLHTHLNYNNVSAKHTVFNKDRLVLINFNKAQTHDCKFQDVIEDIKFRDIIQENLPDPGLERIHCNEIHEYCTTMDLFIPAGYKYKYTFIKINAGMKCLEDFHKAVKTIYPEPHLVRDVALWCEETWPLIEPHLAKYARAPWSFSREERKRLREQQQRAPDMKTQVELSGEGKERIPEADDDDELNFDRIAWYSS